MADTDTESEGSDIISHDEDVDDVDWPRRYIACDDQDDDDNHDIYDSESEFDDYHDGWTTDQFRRRNVRQFTPVRRSAPRSNTRKKHDPSTIST